VQGTGGAMVGDSTYDAEAAGKIDVPTLAVRTGGSSSEELTAAGASAVYDSLIDLLHDLNNTPLCRADTVTHSHR
jgi:phosphoglycolate phosphatase-like HAD superfamily hydrolase